MITSVPFEQELRQKSNTGDAVLTTTYADDYITRGNAFQVRRRISLAASTTTKIVLDTTAVPSTSYIFILPVSVAGTGGPILVDTYGISTYTGGSAIVPAKLNSTSSNVAASLFLTGITSSDVAGNDLRQYIIGATGNPQQVNRSGSSSGAVPYIVAPGSKIVMQINNTYTDTNTIAFDVIWYEIPAVTVSSASTTYSAISSGWTAITSAGQNGVAYLINDGMVLIDHSSTGTGGCSEDKAHRLTKYDAYQNMLFMRAPSTTDIFYVKAKSAPSMSLCVELN